jgi:glycosyltransferase involved in cell wall biosynthesis
MKLLYITNGINGAGGLERVLSVKASYLVDVMGYEVHILRLNEGDVSSFYTFSPQIILHSIKVGGNSLQYTSAYLRGIIRTIKDINPDLISVCDDGLKAFFLPLVLGNRIPIVYERHVSKEIELNVDFFIWKKVWIRFKWKLMATLANRFSKFIVLTNGNKKEWPDLKNLAVIPNPTSFYPISSSYLVNKKVIAIGKQGYQKSYDRLLEAWHLVYQQHSDWELEIYGKIETEEKLEEQALKLGICEKISFYPPTQEIESKYLEASIYVMSSRFEGFGMVLIEAMACGVPCISFDCPHGPADIITDGVDGILVENGDVAGLANALIRLIENEELRKKMGTAAKGNVMRFLPETILPQWDTLFKELIH